VIGIAAACVPIGSTAAYAMDTPHHLADWGGVTASMPVVAVSSAVVAASTPVAEGTEPSGDRPRPALGRWAGASRAGSSLTGGRRSIPAAQRIRDEGV